MTRAAAACALAAAAIAGCGVARYREARARDLQLRFVTSGTDGEELPRWSGEGRLRVERDVVVSARHVRVVRLEERPDGARHLVLYLDAEGQERLAEATRGGEGRRLAIVSGGRVVVAPAVRAPIADGVAHVTVGPESDIEEVFRALAGE